MGGCCAKSNDYTVAVETTKKDIPIHTISLAFTDISEKEKSTDVEIPEMKQKNKPKYKSVKGDKVDETMSKIINSRNVEMPIYRIGEGKYLIGTKSRMCAIKGS